ncbi:putative metallo-hydrolase [Clostridium acetireducens DSM 10703]|jgi:hydroxyacylglutathione hydrolase|uniref:Putative metallo-hydrolase n=1 Tax=Clostridium acetireducens DSM 10703 TaxID=1121290 RepID=A0A1E8EWW3_9CLOT|nr:MBL fold metallo-hydrolase [Clostridium acetireducens]OFI05242.1 putative metallo-hydrolase [Clostridium acetireducens DSM 10703]
MEIKVLPVGAYEANCYILLDENTKEAAVIDPGDSGKFIIDTIKDLKCKVKYIILTHGHLDHTGAVDDLKKEFNAPVCINEKDEKLASKSSFIFGEIKSDKYIKEGDILEIGNIKLKCIETPGHTPGGMSFLVDNIVFTGDTLFFCSIGRTDFEGGDYSTIINSIKTKLTVLPDDTIVLPGHGPKSSIKNEKMNNPFL